MDDALESLELELSRDMGRCIHEFSLIEDGDRVMACLSGGKDSYAMLYLLERARKRAPIRFEIVPVHLDQGHPGYDGSPLVKWCEANGMPLTVLRKDTYSIVTERVPEGKTYCSLCSRLRRGVLYGAAERLGCTKIALGHHADDAIETLLLNLFFAGSLGAMPPRLETKDGKNTVIRPLLYAKESTLAAFAARMQFPILPCDLCGSQEQLQRKQVKALIADLEARIPHIRTSMLAALGHVKPTHLFDARLWKALGLHAALEGAQDGSAAFADTASILGSAPDDEQSAAVAASPQPAESSDRARPPRQLPVI
jgi:tRNA 2-thiocytidine biosynthesis protein TtcA